MQNGNLERGIVQGLGWLSIGLGCAATAAPQNVAKTIGVKDGEPILRLVGARELAVGVGLLSGWQPPVWTWGRVLGDMMDLGLLSAALASERHDKMRVAATTGVIGAITIVDVLSARYLTEHWQAPNESEPEPALIDPSQ